MMKQNPYESLPLNTFFVWLLFLLFLWIYIKEIEVKESGTGFVGECVSEKIDRLSACVIVIGSD